MIVFDGHNDTLTRSDLRSFLQGSASGHIDLPRARQGGFAGGLFAIFTPPPPESPERDPMYGITFTDDGYRVAERSPIDQAYAETFTNGVIDLAYQIEAASHGMALIAKTTGDIERCFARQVLAIVLHLEGAEAIQPDLSNLELYYEKGVRSLGLVWSRPNAFGNGVPFAFPQSPDTGAGLTDTGKALVRECNRLGILLDLAHLNERGFFDVAELSSAPLVVTHADAYAICPSSRNLTDAQIEAVGASGGVIGINFEAMNTHPLSSIDQDVPLTQITRHIDTIVDKIGIDHVCFGSDFDGADMPNDLHDVTGLPKLIDCLRTGGYDNGALEKIAYRNWLRVFSATWK
ncbi:MAG: dipeptidase [Chloroflexota bacterium]